MVDSINSTESHDGWPIVYNPEFDWELDSQALHGTQTHDIVGNWTSITLRLPDIYIYIIYLIYT